MNIFIITLGGSVGEVMERVAWQLVVGLSGVDRLGSMSSAFGRGGIRGGESSLPSSLQANVETSTRQPTLR